MRGFRGRNITPQKSLAASGWDGLFVFFLRTVIPLIPIVGLFVVAVFIINAEVNGAYDGLAPQTGAIRLILDEENDRLTGSLILRTRDRYKIVDGKMLDDNKLSILCQKDDAKAISGMGKGGSKNIAFNKPVSDSSVPDNLSKLPSTQQESSSGPQISIEGSASMGTLTGIMNIDGQKIPFEAKRNSFSSFFGWRWLNRMLRMVGINSSS